VAGRLDEGQEEPGGRHHHVSLVELPAEIIVKILKYMTFRENAVVRLVSTWGWGGGDCRGLLLGFHCSSLEIRYLLRLFL
jgi:hypothetical protein